MTTYFRRVLAAMAKAPSTSKTNASEYKKLNLNRYHAPPNAINSNPEANM